MSNSYTSGFSKQAIAAALAANPKLQDLLQDRALVRLRAKFGLNRAELRRLKGWIADTSHLCGLSAHHVDDDTPRGHVEVYYWLHFTSEEHLRKAFSDRVLGNYELQELADLAQEAIGVYGERVEIDFVLDTDFEKEGNPTCAMTREEAATQSAELWERQRKLTKRIGALELQL